MLRLKKILSIFGKIKKIDENIHSLNLFNEFSLFLYEFLDGVSQLDLELFVELTLPIYGTFIELNLINDNKKLLVLEEHNRKFLTKYKNVYIGDCKISSDFIEDDFYYENSKVINLGTLYNSTLILLPGSDGINLDDDGRSLDELKTTFSYKNIYYLAAAQLLIYIYLKFYQNKKIISAKEFYQIEFDNRINSSSKKV